jgi:hypothetical protein
MFDDVGVDTATPSDRSRSCAVGRQAAADVFDLLAGQPSDPVFSAGIIDRGDSSFANVMDQRLDRRRGGAP